MLSLEKIRRPHDPNPQAFFANACTPPKKLTLVKTPRAPHRGLFGFAKLLARQAALEAFEQSNAHTELRRH
jgi:hypothetical protein